jgi:predicted DNA-binding protein
MGKTKRHQQAIYLDPKKAALLDRLSSETGVTKQYYFRQAVDMLLEWHGLLKPKRKP